MEQPPAAGAILSTVRRSDRIESWHRGSLVVVRGDEVLHRLGAPDRPIYSRSAIKPLQALPLLERGIAARLSLTPPELALLSASHNGTPRHVEVVEQILARGGFTRDDLLCGPHAPFDQKASRAITAASSKPHRIHNNCSGKHAGFLLLAADMGVPQEQYLDPESASQQLIRRTVAEMAGLAYEDLGVGVDGCGAPTLHLPLTALARAFANLTNPQHLPPVRADACKTLLGAISEHPELLAGAGRLCTALIRSRPGAIYPKNGAEGLYAFGLPGRGLGVAIKVDDGAERGYQPVVVDLLRALSHWDEVPDPLRSFHLVPLRNTRKLVVGEVACAVSWPAVAWPPVTWPT